MLPPPGSGEVSGRVYLHGAVDRKVALPVEIIFEEGKLARDSPVDRGHSDAGGAHDVKAVEIAALHADEGAGDLLIGVVAPRRGIGGGTGEHSNGEEIADVAAEIAAVDGA